MPMAHLELSFVYSVRYGSNFFSIFYLIVSASVVHVCFGLILDSLFCSIDLFVSPYTSTAIPAQ